MSFVLLDLDHFKQINDLHGHGTGDSVLKQFAKTVRAGLRDSDVFGRMGGEEFGLILPGTDEPGAQQLMEGIRRTVQEMRVVNAKGLPVRVTVSAGIAGVQASDEVHPERLYGRADRALYVAKRSGRNRVERYVSDGSATMVPTA
jgi:diguanylate cyclase (GGDEF)-like protein